MYCNIYIFIVWYFIPVLIVCVSHFFSVCFILRSARKQMQPGERRGFGRFPCYGRGRSVRRRRRFGRRAVVTGHVHAGSRRRVPSQDVGRLVAVRGRQQHRPDGFTANEHGLLPDGGRSELPPSPFHHAVPVQPP